MEAMKKYIDVTREVRQDIMALKIIGEIAHSVPCHSRLTPHTGKASIYID